MYSDRELNRLAAHKAALRGRIAVRRVECAAAAAGVARPLAWLDRATSFWRSLSPLAQLAVVPIGYLITRHLSPRLKILGAVARWGPLAFGALRGLGALFQSRSGVATSSPDRD